MKSVTPTRHLGAHSSHTHRLSLVAGACALALGVSLAHAQTSTYSLTLTPAVTADPTATPPVAAADATAVQNLANDSYMLWVTNPQFNQGSTSGTIETSPNLANINLTGGGATPATLTNNSVTAIASGNQNTTTGNLGLLSNAGSIGTLSAQVQFGGTTSTKIDGSVVSVSESGMAAAPATITGNGLTATATVNRSDTTVSGAVPAGYSSAQTGSISVGYDAASGVTDSAGTGSATTSASVNLNTFQTSLDASSNAGSKAEVLNSNVQLAIQSATGALSAPLTVSSNTLSA
ncbi:MAG: hypothetical protein RLZZ371_2476, partial [Pseudomonadota bacterium]